MAEEARRNDCPLPKGRGKDVKLVPTSRPDRAPSPQRDNKRAGQAHGSLFSCDPPPP